MSRDREEVLDELWVLRSQGGDALALERLVERWQPRFLRYAVRLLGDAEAAADTVQEAWVAIVRGLGRLDDPARFVPWALRILANKCRDRIRRTVRRRRLQEEVERQPPPPTEEPAGDDRRGRVRAALASMAGERRALLAMAYTDGLSLRQIAAALGIPEGTVKSRLFHARSELRKVMEERS